MSLAIKLQNLLMDEELSNRYFGEYNQVSVLGYFKDGPVNRYVIHCDECSKDIDLFGQGNFVTTKRTLLRGGLPCNCKRNRQQQAYINLIKDGDLVIAVKFGIANNAKNRIRSQITNSVYSVVNHAVYEFPSRLLCLRAERECKQTLVCGVITKLEMKDGYTETTQPSNLNSIIEIYERNGGVFCP